MKRIILFTFLGPLIGVLIFFLPILIATQLFGENSDSISFWQSLLVLLWFLIFGYFVALFPAFLVGVIAKFLTFKNPWINYAILNISSATLCLLYFSDQRNDWYSMLVIMGVLTTMILGYFFMLKGKIQKKEQIYMEEQLCAKYESDSTIEKKRNAKVMGGKS